uniref:Uncharacterized protein n=1 Tax=Arundo donax TaxID=35708 RepID=A0A0A8ZGA4_ARUDO
MPVDYAHDMLDNNQTCQDFLHTHIIKTIHMKFPL